MIIVNRSYKNGCIKWWNLNQHKIIKIIRGDINTIWSMTFRGYFSVLCRWALKTEEERSACINSAIERYDISVIPLFSQNIINALQKRMKNERCLIIHRG